MSASPRLALAVLASLLLAGTASAQSLLPQPITAEAINAAPLDDTALPAVPISEPPVIANGWAKPLSRTSHPNPSLIRLQVLLDRAGASPGVVDGYDGDNVRKAVLAFELMQGMQADGVIDADMLARLETPDAIVGTYTITPEDVSAIVAPLPKDYAELAQRDFLGYTSVQEELAERFHMNVKLLKTLNASANFAAGDQVFVTAPGLKREGVIATIQADKALRQVRAYGADGLLIAAYPATIGSEDNPSPSGTHIVEGVAPNPTYTYNPKINFQQGKNTPTLLPHLSPQGGEKSEPGLMSGGAVGIPSPLRGGKAAAKGGGSPTRHIAERHHLLVDEVIEHHRTLVTLVDLRHAQHLRGDALILRAIRVFRHGKSLAGIEPRRIDHGAIAQQFDAPRIGVLQARNLVFVVWRADRLGIGRAGALGEDQPCLLACLHIAQRRFGEPTDRRRIGHAKRIVGFRKTRIGTNRLLECRRGLAAIKTRRLRHRHRQQPQHHHQHPPDNHRTHPDFTADTKPEFHKHSKPLADHIQQGPRPHPTPVALMVRRELLRASNHEGVAPTHCL
jgi:peptidoglycan hydrolase-like protein with peptidoglycan-binding domain